MWDGQLGLPVVFKLPAFVFTDPKMGELLNKVMFVLHNMLCEWWVVHLSYSIAVRRWSHFLAKCNEFQEILQMNAHEWVKNELEDFISQIRLVPWRCELDHWNPFLCLVAYILETFRAQVHFNWYRPKCRECNVIFLMSYTSHDHLLSVYCRYAFPPPPMAVTWLRCSETCLQFRAY